MININVSILHLEKVRLESFSSMNSHHEALLEKLWKALKPYTRRNGRITKEWQEIGFQGKDPATDFRGMVNDDDSKLIIIRECLDY